MVEPSAATLRAEIEALLERSKQLRLLATENMRESAEALAEAERLIEEAEKRARTDAQRLRRVLPAPNDE
jgi:cell division septum initiation protein DivIVA